MSLDIAARVYRGETVEAEHCAAVAVVDGSGKLTNYLGSPEKVFATRSSVKPFQAVPLVKAGGVEKFGLSEAHLALICSSHSGTDRHRALALEILGKIGLPVEALQCGACLPLDMAVHKTYPQNDEHLDPLRNDCSGKHSGFLALATMMGEPIDDYLKPEHPVQQLVRRAVGDCCEIDASELTVAIDGCSAPVFGMPLVNLARGFRNLATGQGKDEASSSALRRIFEAMTTYPELVAGEGRFDTDLMRAFDGLCVTKVGAEAIQAIGISDPPLGIAVKILDGTGARALGPVCVEVLKQLGLLEKADLGPIQGYARPEVRNHRGIVTGRITVDFSLKST